MVNLEGVGGLITLWGFGDMEVVERGHPLSGEMALVMVLVVVILAWSSSFFHARSFSNLAFPGLEQVTLVWEAYDRGVSPQLSVSTWAPPGERGTSGWTFLPPLPTVSHSPFDSSVGVTEGVSEVEGITAGETT